MEDEYDVEKIIDKRNKNADVRFSWLIAFKLTNILQIVCSLDGWIELQIFFLDWI